MHEYPITKRIIAIAEKYANEHHAKEIKKIHLVVGDLCGYVASSIDLYFEIIAQDGLCKNAVLSIRRIKPKLRCSKCNQLFERKAFSFECSHCGADGVPTDIGREFYIESIEI